MKKAIEVENLRFSYDGAQVLSGVDLSVEKRGGISAILGPNGAGKSTLLKLIAGLLRPVSGRVAVLGRNSEDYSAAELARAMAYAPGEMSIPYDFSVFDIVLMGRAPYLKWWRGYGKNDRRIVGEVIAEMGLSPFSSRSVNSLSSGEKQLVFIAQALAQEPEILVLDEPTAHLDVKYKIRVMEILKRFCSEKNLPVIMVSHDISLVLSYAEKAFFLKNGGIFYGGDPREAAEKGIIREVYDLPVEIAFPEYG